MPLDTPTGGAMPGPTLEPVQTAADGVAGACAAATGAQTTEPATSASATSRRLTSKRTASRTRWLRIPPGQRGRLALLARLAAESHAGAHRTCDEPSFGIRHISLREPDRPPCLDHVSRCDQGAGPERPQEVDLQLESREALAVGEGRRIRHSHSCVRDVAEDAPVQRAHRVRMLRACLQLEDRLPHFDRPRAEADELPHRGDRLVLAHALRNAIDQPRHGAALHPDRVPYGLELEERSNLVWALRIVPAPNHPLHVLRHD